MVKALFKLFVLVVMGVVTVGSTYGLLNVTSDWGRYTIHSTVGPGTAITVEHPHDGEPVHAETTAPVSAQRTLDMGSFSILVGAFGLAVLTGFILRGRESSMGRLARKGFNG